MKRVMIFMTATAVMLMIAACDNGNLPLPPKKSAQVMLIHASPDAPGVDAFLDDVPVAENLEYPNSTRYTSLKEGEHNVKLNVTGTDVTVIDADLDFVAEQHYSIFACDAVANLAALMLEDNFISPPIGSGQVRFVHLSPDAPAVDVTLTDGTVLFGNVAFKGSTPFEPVAAAKLDLQVRLAGTETVVLEVKDVVIAPGVAYTIWAKGFVNGEGAQALGAEIIINKLKF